MSVHARTNYVRPHAKASFIRPICCYNENEYINKEPLDYFPTMKHLKSPVKGSNSLYESDSIKNISNSKEKNLQDLDSAHSKLYAEIDKIQTWTTSIDSECKQKNKKVEELTQIVESQRKVVLDLQMQNENLSMRLSEEIHQRLSILEKFTFAKELFLNLRKQFCNLQGQFDACLKLKKAVDACCDEKAATIENLIKKSNKMGVQYSENLVTLNNALKSERQNNVVLKELCEQQNAHAEKEHKSLCKLIENYQEELKNYSKDFQGEKDKVLTLQHEKDDMLLKITRLESAKEADLKKMMDLEKELKLTVEKKLEIENSYISENIKVSELNIKCEELEELRNKQTTELEENSLALKTTIDSLEKSVSELKQKLEDSEYKNEKLTGALQEREDEKCSLEKEILNIKKENEDLKNKIIIDARISDETTDKLMKEKNDLNTSLNLVQDELQKNLLDKEKISKVSLENEEKLLEITKEYETAISKIKEFSIMEEKYFDTLKKIKIMETDLLMKADLLVAKEKEIEEMHQLKLKYDESINKIKELEEYVHAQSEQVKLKDMRIEELSTAEEKFTQACNTIERLEKNLASKEELLISKDMRIEELSTAEEKFTQACNTIERLEKNLASKEELLISKEQTVEEINIAQQNYNAVLEKVHKLEDDIKHKTKLLVEGENKIKDLNSTLEKKNKELDKVQYENLEMKDNLQKERESVKVCLECEIMKDKVKETNHLLTVLTNTEKELINQKQQTSHVMKMLSETEENFDQMRIKKEKEIIKCKDTIQSLQHELKILKVEAREVEKLRSENEKLYLKIEEQALQNAGDSQRLMTENEMMKTEIDSLKANKNLPLSNSENTLFQMQSKDISKKFERSPFKCKTENGTKMEADSSDEITFIKEELKPKSPLIRKISREVNKRTSQQECLKTPLIVEKRKRAWETESSGSECLELVFNRDGKKSVVLTPKNKPAVEFKKTPVNIFSSRKPLSREIRDEQIPCSDQSSKPKTIISFTSSMNKKSVKSEREDMDFLSSKGNIKEENFEGSPWRESSFEMKRTPLTPLDRKFFKTPLKERDHSFKKPPLQKWF